MSNTLVVLGALIFCCWASPQNEKSVKTENADFSYPDELDVRTFSRGHYHTHHHHHHPDFFHNRPYGWRGAEGDEADEREESEDDANRNNHPNSTMQIPLDFIQNFNEYNVSDLLLHFVEGYENEAPFIQDRFNDADERVTATVNPKGAACMPELTTVKLVTNEDPNVLYIPQCTRIERCGGCCSHPLLSCQAVDKEYVNFKVIKTEYTGGKKLKLVGKEVVPVERHIKCKCDCRIQPQDCNKFQEYKKSQCQCVCTNSDEEKKCYKNNNTKLWNPDLCICQCRESLQCSTGSYFDQNECKCVSLPLKRRGADYTRKIQRYEPLPVVPLNEED